MRLRFERRRRLVSLFAAAALLACASDPGRATAMTLRKLYEKPVGTHVSGGRTFAR